jgi:hypothetical protein
MAEKVGKKDLLLSILNKMFFLTLGPLVNIIISI